MHVIFMWLVLVDVCSSYLQFTTTYNSLLHHHLFERRFVSVHFRAVANLINVLTAAASTWNALPRSVRSSTSVSGCSSEVDSRQNYSRVHTSNLTEFVSASL